MVAATDDDVTKLEAPQPRIVLQLLNDGPILVKGAISIIYGTDNENGQSWDPSKPMALCRCGHSKNKPFCDSSHANDLTVDVYMPHMPPGEIE